MAMNDEPIRIERPEDKTRRCFPPHNRGSRAKDIWDADQEEDGVDVDDMQSSYLL